MWISRNQSRPNYKVGQELKIRQIQLEIKPDCQISSRCIGKKNGVFIWFTIGLSHMLISDGLNFQRRSIRLAGSSPTGVVDEPNIKLWTYVTPASGK